MRNLHHDRIYFDSPMLISILAEFDITATPKVDKSVLRRFIMGQKLVSFRPVERRKVLRKTLIDFVLDSATSIDALIDDAKEQAYKSLTDKGIELDDITSVEFLSGHGEADQLEVSYMALETDAELDVRNHHVNLFEAILTNKDAIYTRIDEELAKQKMAS